jgi:hypothetical protein
MLSPIYWRKISEHLEVNFTRLRGQNNNRTTELKDDFKNNQSEPDEMLFICCLYKIYKMNASRFICEVTERI